MDKLKALYESYINEGILSRETTFEQFSTASSEVQDDLYQQGLDNKILSNQTDLSMFKSAWSLKKKVVTPSDGVEEVTVSTTETETPVGSADGLEVNDKEKEFYLEEDLNSLPPYEVGTGMRVPSVRLEVNDKEKEFYLEEDLNSLMDLETATDTYDFDVAGSAMARMMRKKNRSVDPELKKKILSDFNISSSIKLGVINEALVDSALRGDKKSIETLRDISIKNPEYYQSEKNSEKLQSFDVYSEKQNYTETEEDKLITQNAVNLVAAFDAETKILLDAKPNATEEEMQDIFNREGAPTEEQYEIAENSDYQPTGFEDEYIGGMYNQEALIKLSDNNTKFSIAGFNGYLNKKGYEKKYRELIEDESISQDSVGYDYFNQYSPTLASERIRYNYLKNYLAETDMQRIQKEVLDYQVANGGKNPFLNGDGDKINLEPSIEIEELNDFVEDNFKNLNKALTDVQQETKANYQRELSGGSGGDDTQWLFDSGSQAGRSVNDRISSVSEAAYGWIGMDSTVDKIRLNQAETELNRDDMLRYTYASGKSAFVNGREYLIDDKGEIFDLDLKIRVSSVLEPSQIEEIRKGVEKNGVKTSSFSGTGAAVTTAGVAADVVLQLALTRGVGVAGQTLKGIGMASKYKQGRSVIDLLSKVPMKATTASSMIAQGTLMGTSLSSDVRKQALDAGMSIEEADDLSQTANSQGFILGVVTGPLSTQTGAMQSLFGGKVKEKVISETIRSYAKGAGIESSKSTLRKMMDAIIKKAPGYVKAGGAETFQENVQQSGQAFVIGADINERAGREIMSQTISGDQFMETSIISFAAGMFMPFAGDLKTGVMRSYNMRGKGFQAIDEMKTLALLSKNSEKTKELLNSQVKAGVYTQQQVDDMLADINIYKNNANSLPPNLSAETSLSVLSDLNKIKELEAQKAKEDPSFAKFTDLKIRKLRNRITKNSNFDYISNRGKQGLMDEAGRELVAEKEAAGDQEFSIDNTEIRQRAIDNFNELSQEEQLKFIGIETEVKVTPEQETEVKVTPEQETEVESPIKDNLQENETIVQTRKDDKGRVFTTTKQESVRERDGMKVTKIKFNRSDKATDQRNDSFVSEEAALADTNYEINPEDRLEQEEGETATYEITEIREGDTGAAASVKITTIDADGNQIGSFQDDVTLVEKTEQSNKVNVDETTVVPTTKPETKKFQDNNVILKEETFTITDEDGSRQEVTVRTYLDGSLGTGAKVKRFDSNGELIEESFRVNLGDNDLIVRDGLTAEEQVEFGFAGDGSVMEKTSERSGTAGYVFGGIKVGELTTEQKQKLGIETKKDESEQTVSEIDEVTVTEDKVVPAGKRLFNKPNPETTEISKKYKKDRNDETPEGEPITSIDKDNSREIADVYESLEDSPNDPKVQEAYLLMADETAEQYKEITDAGYKVEIWKGKGDPYANAQEMIDDVRENKHMWIFSTESGFGDTEITEEQRQQNKLLQDSGSKDKNGDTLLYNDLFRFVHDFFGHTERGNGFGPVGEENAWDVHSRMYTPLARRAMTTETRGQNSWVNFGPQMRNDKGELIKKGEDGYIIPKERAFAPQKMALMPEKYSELLPEGEVDSGDKKVAPSKTPATKDKAPSTKKTDVEKTEEQEGDVLKKLQTTFDKNKKAIQDRVKKTTFKQKLRLLREKIFDRQTRVKDILKNVGSKEAKQASDLLVTKAGATGYASFRFKKADSKIYKGLSDTDIEMLDQIIYLKRVVAINENRIEQNKEGYIGLDGINYNIAKEGLDAYKKKVGDKKYNELYSRANEYFKAFDESLKRMRDAGLISEQVYKELRDIEYSPIKTLEYIISENADAAEIDRMANMSGMRSSVIKNLGDVNTKEIIMDSRFLLSSNIGMIEARIAENKLLNSFNEAVENAEGDVKELIELNIKSNPVIGKTKSGNLIYKYDKKNIPPGFTKVEFLTNGVKNYMVMEKTYADQLLDVKTSSKFAEKIGKRTGVNILRFLATSGNPLFIIGNTAVDFSNILLLSDVYSNNKFVGGAELAFDFVKQFGSKVGNTKAYNKIYEEFMEHGGAMDYLSSDGIKAINSKDKSKIANSTTKVMTWWGSKLSYLGETSEVSFRVAVYAKVKNNLTKDFKKENKREPNKEEMEAIMFAASREARETIDFNQGGSTIKSLDKAMPYLNAATQGLRKGVDYVAKNPKQAASNALQLMIASAGFASLSIFNVLRNLDDEDEILDILNSVSDYEKANYHIVFSGKKDEDGEWEYTRAKKLPTTAGFSTIAEQLAISAILKSRGIEYDSSNEAINKSILNISPIDFSNGITGLLNRNPLIGASLTYGYNYDMFYDQQIFKGPRGKLILPQDEGMYDDRVATIYKDLGKLTGLSPIRGQAAVQKIVTSETTNPMVGLVYSGYDKMKGLLGEAPEKNEVSSVLDKTLKNVERKLFRTTNKNLLSYKNKDENEEFERYTESSIYSKEQKVYKTIKDRLKEKPYTREEYVKLITDNFDPIDRKKYYKKYLGYMNNMDGDRTILDIVFEDTPEVQAMLIFNKFGDSFEDEEIKEIRKVYSASRRKFSKKALYIYRQKYQKLKK